MDVGKKVFQVQHRIPHDLTGAMVGDIAATVDVMIGSADRMKLIARYEQVAFLAAFPKGENVGMLAEKKMVGGELFVFRMIPVVGLRRQDPVKKRGLVIPGFRVA